MPLKVGSIIKLSGKVRDTKGLAIYEGAIGKIVDVDLRPAYTIVFAGGRVARDVASWSCIPLTALDIISLRLGNEEV